jgi:hypothetical protein
VKIFTKSAKLLIHAQNDSPHIPSLADICPIIDLQQFILDVFVLFQRKPSETKLKNSLMHLIKKIYDPRPRRHSLSSKDSSNSSPPKTKKHKK